MAKYHGKIGFVHFTEKVPGVVVEVPVEREYFGEVLRNTKRWDSAQQVNPNLNINNQISVVADPYARDNLSAIRYASWIGALWEITSVEVQYPRLILQIGGVYNGPTVGSSGMPGGSDGCWCDGPVPAATER